MLDKTNATPALSDDTQIAGNHLLADATKAIKVEAVGTFSASALTASDCPYLQTPSVQTSDGGCPFLAGYFQGTLCHHGPCVASQVIVIGSFHLSSPSRHGARICPLMRHLCPQLGHPVAPSGFNGLPQAGQRGTLLPFVGSVGELGGS